MNKSEKFWDRMAKYFDRAERKDEPINNKIIEKTRTFLKISDNVLDYGCGTGTVAIEIAGSVTIVHGIDISSKMIDVAKEKTLEHKVKNIDLAQTTIFDEKLETGSFDVILCFYLLHLVEDTPKVMQRINELLKPGGLFLSATPCMRGTFLGVLLSPVSKIGLIPQITSFKITELEDSIASEYFEIIETECLNQRSQQYFIAAKRK